jgi:serine/threonine-protein kinase
MGFEKHLVIKRILPHLAEDPQFVAMFLGEAKLAAQLNHPNLVQLFDFGEAEGSYFIAMEFIDGPTLRLLLARARDQRAPPSFALSARIVSSAAEGLAYAHDFRDQVSDEPLQLVHRDVSPDNILVGRSGAVKLVDFGIAKARGQTHHTQAGTVKGKVAYMAPEQLRGEALDRRVDLYALGVVLYELCTGRMPFEANSDASMVRAVLYDAAIPAVRRVPSLPPPIQAILDRLLAKDRDARYADCRTLHADLETSSGPPVRPRTGSRSPAWSRSSRRPLRRRPRPHDRPSSLRASPRRPSPRPAPSS